MMNAEFSFAIQILQSAVWMIGIGLLLFITGLLHLNPTFNRWDVRSFRCLHKRLRRYSGFFRYIWPLGTTPVAIMLILIIYTASWQAGLAASLTYFLAAFLERVIKLKIRRPRPFETFTDVQMHQPHQPRDPSHPSGDSLRVWFLALIFPLSFALPWSALALTILVAATLSLGRIALGVHYPFDVISGAGLGILSAGIAVTGHQLAVIS